MKTKGFNLEDTRLTMPDRLSTLLALIACAIGMAVKTGAALAAIKPIIIKKHGRPAVSYFAFGLGGLRKLLAGTNIQQILVYLVQLLSPKMPAKTLCRLAF